MVAVDVNADGYPDLVGFAGGSIGIILNRQDGTFTAPTYYSLDDSPCPGQFAGGTGMAVGDFNRNGGLEVAAIGVCSFGTSPQLNLFANTGNGTLTGPAIMSLTDGSTDVIAADLNNDGYLDLVTANGNTSGAQTLSVLMNQKERQFRHSDEYRRRCNAG